MTLELNPDFADFLRELGAADVDYVVVGGFAVAAHGFFRATKDLDVFVRPSVENARRTYAALARFGAPLHALTREDLAQPELVFQIGVPPRRIDVLTSISGVDFDEANAGAATMAMSGVDVRIIGLDALLVNKRATGRPEDKRDVRELVRLHAPAQSKSTGKSKSKKGKVKVKVKAKAKAKAKAKKR